ncbi:MAG: hypothetical protein ABSE44_00495 [Candidatus Sulfotelmatobacter sp.]
MRLLKIILGLAVLILVTMAGWQIGSSEVANMNLPGEKSILYVAADYTVPVNLVFYSFNLHFTPSSDKKGS